MHIGITWFATDRSIRPDDMAREAEARGFHSLYVPEHTHIPTSRATPAPMGDPLPEEYRRCLDPFVAMSMAAAVTTRLRVGTGICLVAQHDPVALAKAVASVDHLSGGRFVFGVGFGWNREEMADHGVAYEDRRAVVRERVLAMRRLWEDEEAAFTGDHVALAPSWAWPKPLQQPGPPILVGGGAGPTLFAHAAEWADGWIPIGGSGLAADIPRLQEAFAAAGRDPAEARVVPFGSVPTPGKLDHFRSLGIDEVVLRAPSAGRDEVLPLLDAWTELLTG